MMHGLVSYNVILVRQTLEGTCRRKRKCLWLGPVMMISTGGIIGAGLVVGSSTAIAAMGLGVVVNCVLAGVSESHICDGA